MNLGGRGADGGGTLLNMSASWRAPKATSYGLKEGWGVVGLAIGEEEE